MSDANPFDIDFKLSNVDAAKLTVKELIASFNAAERAVLKLAQADATAGASLKELQARFERGEVSADELRQTLAAIAAQAPKTGSTLARESREAAKELAKQAEAAREAAKAQAEHTAEVRRFDEARARQASQRGRGDPLLSAQGTAQALAVTVGAVTAGVAGIALATRALGEAGAAGERHALALQRLGPAYALVQRATADTLSADAAYRAQLTLTRSGLRLTGDELALIARHAREHKDSTVSAEEAVQQFAEALRQGEAGGLRAYGISAQEGATRSQQFERALRQMRQEAARSSPSTRTLAEDTARVSTAVEEAGGAFARLAAHLLGLPSTMGAIADSLRAIVTDVNDLIDAEERAPRERAQRDARLRAQREYAAEVARAGQTLTELGVGRDDPRRRGLFADPAAFGRLSPEQQQAAAVRLAQVNRDLAASRAPQRDLSTLLATRDTSAVRADARLGAGFNDNARPLSPAELEAEAAALRARRAPGGTGDEARRAQDRAVAIGRLTAITSEIAGQARAAAQTAPGQTGPRDTAATAAALDPLGVLNARIGQVRQQAQEAQAALRSQQELLRAELETAELLATSDVERAQVEERLRAQRIAGLRAEQQLQRESAAALRPLIAEAEGAMGAVRQRAQRVQAETVRNQLQSEQVTAVREQLRLQTELQRVEAEGVVAVRERARATKEAAANAADEAERRFHAREIGVLGTEQGAANYVAEQAGSRRLGRVQGALSRRGELDYLRSDEGQTTELADMAGQAELARERSLLQQRFELQRSFTERWEELHRRQFDAVGEFAAQSNGVLSAFSGTYVKHLGLLASGQETAAVASKAAAGEFLSAVSERTGGRAAEEFAEGVAALATPITAPTAPGHFAGSAALLAVSVATGATGARLARAAQTAGGSAGASGGGSGVSPVQSAGTPTRALGAGAVANDNGGGGVINITLGGGVIMGTSKQLAEELGRILNSPSSNFRLDARTVRAAGGIR